MTASGTQSTERSSSSRTDVASKVRSSVSASSTQTPRPSRATRSTIDRETLNSGSLIASRSRLRAAATWIGPAACGVAITKPRSAPTSSIALSRIEPTSPAGSSSRASRAATALSFSRTVDSSRGRCFNLRDRG